MVVFAIDRPRSAIISTRPRTFGLNRRYRRMHRMTILRSTWRLWTALRRSSACSLPTSTNSAGQRSRSDRAICTRAALTTLADLGGDRRGEIAVGRERESDRQGLPRTKGAVGRQVAAGRAKVVERIDLIGAD